MSNARKLLKGMEKKYTINAILSPIVMIGEVCVEVIIPFIMKNIIDIGIHNKDLSYVLKYGCLMIGLLVFDGRAVTWTYSADFS